jgi:hypothetical protein
LETREGLHSDRRSSGLLPVRPGYLEARSGTLFRNILSRMMFTLYEKSGKARSAQKDLYHMREAILMAKEMG